MADHLKSRTAIGLALALGVATITAPAIAPAAEPNTGGTLIYANNSGPGTLDPQMAASLVELEVIHQLYEGLVTIDKDYNTAPMLAESVEISPDAKTFTFKLREGVKFHDGSDMTSEDVKATFLRYARVSPNASALDGVEGYEVPDPYTFIIHLKEPNAVFVDVLKTPVYPFAILPAEQQDAEPRKLGDIIGTGPFKLGEWVRDSHLVIEKFESYVADDRPGPDGYAGHKEVYLDAVRYNFMPEANSRVAAMQTGEADITSSLPNELVDRLEDVPGVKPITIFPYCMQYLILHAQNAPTNNVKIRQAIRAAVDVDDMIAVTGGGGRKNHSMVYSFSPYYQGDAMARYYDQGDPEAAKALLEEAGYDGQEIVLQTNTNYDYMRNTTLVLAEQLEDAGMNVRIDITDWTTNASNMQQGTGDWNVSTTSFCSAPLLGPQQWKIYVYSFPHVKDTEVLDKAYEKFFTSLDLKDRVDAWSTIENEMLGKAYLIKVQDRGSHRAYSTDRMAGFEEYYMNFFWNVWLKK